MVERFAVVDVETTGLHSKDRIVEIAVVTIDGSSLQVVDEFDTLVNPMRDVGPTDIHGITGAMVEAAPTLSEILPLLRGRLDGAVLVAHNLGFDARMLAQDIGVVGASFDPGAGLCTLRMTGLKLALAVQEFGIALESHHRALADARASAELFRRLYKGSGHVPAVLHCWDTGSVPRTHRRDAHGHTLATPLVRGISRACYPSSDPALIEYFDALDWVLADGVVTDDERGYLDELVATRRIDAGTLAALHRAYFDSIVAAVLRDGFVSAAEHAALQRAAAALGVEADSIPQETARPTASALSPGMTVCFTGAAVSPDGTAVRREELEAAAARHGLQPVSSVTKKCSLLVGDISSGSGKAQKARGYGIPIMTVAEFLELISG